MELRILPPDIHQALERLPRAKAADICELRFRLGRPVGAVYPWGEETLCLSGKLIPVTESMLRELVDRATEYSPYKLRLEETGLFFPLEGGCRMGICGEGTMRDGEMTGLRHISSVVIRFARECVGVGAETALALTKRGFVESAIIISPPGGGKTTLLRDLIRAVSERGYRVSVVDERKELSAPVKGKPTLELGAHTDVLSGVPKAVGIPTMVRVMNPQVIAVDELDGEREIEAVIDAMGSGVAVFATAHASSLDTLKKRTGWDRLLGSGLLSRCIQVRRGEIRMEELGEHAKDSGNFTGGDGISFGRNLRRAGAKPTATALVSAAAGAGADAGRDGAEAPYDQRAV